MLKLGYQIVKQKKKIEKNRKIIYQLDKIKINSTLL
jgi:hypothetical protein